MDTTLTPGQEELVAIGAAIAANCEPCLRHHVGKAREAGLDDGQLRAAVAIARMVKETPARLILQAAERLLPASAPATAPSAEAAPAGAPRAGCSG